MRTKRSTRAAVVWVLKWMRYPRRQVNAVVNTETARDQRVDPIAIPKLPIFHAIPNFLNHVARFAEPIMSVQKNAPALAMSHALS